MTDTGWLAVLAPTSTEGAVLMPPSDMRLAARLATSASLGSGSTARRAASEAAELTTVWVHMSRPKSTKASNRAMKMGRSSAASREMDPRWPRTREWRGVAFITSSP